MTALVDDRAELLAHPANDLADIFEQHGLPRASNGKHGCPNPAHVDQTGKSPPVNITGEVWYCHNCGATGSAVDFLMLAHHWTTAEAFTELRRRAGRPATSTSSNTNSNTNGSTQPRIVDRYPYTDEDGTVLYEVVRYEPKDFRQRRPDGNGGWIWNMTGVDKTIFRLPRVLAAAALGEAIIICEGEKDALALEAGGIVATCNPGGAGKWRPEYCEPLKGAQITIWADDDIAGHDHAWQVHDQLAAADIPSEVKVSTKAKDAAAHIGAGHGFGPTEYGPLERPEGPGPTADSTSGRGNLPEAFWSRPALRHIRQAAHARGRGGEAVLAGVLARVAAVTPPTITLPAINGPTQYLNIIHAVIAPSGGGKSAAFGVARQLIPIDHDDPDIGADLPVGSGEGVVDAFLGMVDEEYQNEDGKKTTRKVRRQVRRAILMVIDEGQVLSQIASRAGSTLLPILRSAWNGEAIGQTNASVETNRRLGEGKYRVSILAAWQPIHAATIMDDAPAGTPQRIVWFPGCDPTIPDKPPPWPGQLRWTPPPAHKHTGPVALRIDPEVAQGVWSRGLVKARGEDPNPADLDSHADLVKLKVAGLLAVLDGRLDINGEDWKLAGMVMMSSHVVRSSVIAHARSEAQRRDDASTARAVRRDGALSDSAGSRSLDRAAKAIGRKVQKADGPVSRRDMGHAVASRDRANVTTEDAVAEAERLRWITPVEGGWLPGESRLT